tara:strand:- start:209 stop:1327 length:1119 start_codon:yes stop_codon:yes gene_type:complete
MERRKVLTTGATALTTAVSTAFLSSCTVRRENNSSVNSLSLPKIKWRMATSWPYSLDTIYGGAEIISERVKELSGGNFQIKPYAGGELVPGLEVLDAVQRGSVECGHTASYYYKGKNACFAFGTSVPFGLTAQQQNAWLYEGGGNQALNKIFSDFGVISFPAGNTGAQMGGWFKTKIDSLKALKGLKMRIPGLGGEVMSQLGVNVQVLPAGEVYLALDRGAIDAAEWTGPYDDEKLGFAKAARFYYYPGWWEPGPTLNALVNQKAWIKLPSEYKSIFKTACYEANLTMLSRYESLNGAALQRLIKGGTELIEYEKNILIAAKEASMQLYSDISNKDTVFRDFYRKWLKFKEEVSAWNKVNEYSFLNFLYSKD